MQIPLENTKTVQELPDPSFPRAGDAIHPALREREGSGFETIV